MRDSENLKKNRIYTFYSFKKNFGQRFNEKYFSTFGDSVLHSPCAYCYFVMFESIKNALAIYKKKNVIDCVAV